MNFRENNDNIFDGFNYGNTENEKELVEPDAEFVEQREEDEDTKRQNRIEQLRNKLKSFYEDENELKELFEPIDESERAITRINQGYKALNMEYNSFIDKFFDPDDKQGFNKVIFERQNKLKALRERLKQYYLNDNELDILFKIIERAEFDMEKVKKKFPKNYETTDMMRLQKDLVMIQKKMKEDFEKKLSEMLKAKYDRAKKIKEELDRKQGKNPF